MRVILVAALAAVALGWMLLTNIGASMALADIAARPILALTRGGVRLPVQAPGRPAAAGEAAVIGGSGILFGQRQDFALPDGNRAACTIRFRRLRCSNGWQAERAPR